MIMNKTQLKNRARQILHNYAVGELVTSTDDYNFLIDIFNSHPDLDAKRGRGVVGITTRTTPYNNNRISQ